MCGSSPGGTTLKTPLLEGFFVFYTKKHPLGNKWGNKLSFYYKKSDSAESLFEYFFINH